MGRPLMGQLRLNPLTGRWVTLVQERGLRPTDFAPRIRNVEADPSAPCPFCRGNEEATPPALATFSDEGDWTLRVVPNRYPAFRGEEPMTVSNLGPVFTQAQASGVHEVLVYTPDHGQSFADLDDDGAARTMRALRERFAAHAGAGRIRYTQAIVNHGREAGASLSHPHGQLLGIPFVPGEILDEEAGFGRFEGQCLLCATVEAEVADGDRLVIDNGDVVVVIIPRTHESHLQRTDDDTLEAVGRALRDVLDLLRSHLGDVAYNLVIHSAPHKHEGMFHWHIHVWPKLSTIAGFERGTGVMINIAPPEQAAAALRRARIAADV
jgi:UDPglucose--hexose-1-phosphate uridylyltransferase